MSEGAPSTSGAATPTPAPAPEQTQAKPAQAPAGAEPKLENAAGENERKTRSRLPGVLEAGPEDDVERDVAQQLFGDDSAEGDRKMRPRGPDGRFLKSEEGAEPAPKPGLPEGVETPEPKPEKFKFAGEEWDNAEKAEQNFKTLRGMHKSLQGQLKQAESDRDYGYEAAQAWQRYSDGLKARIAELEGGAARPAGQDQPRRTEAEAGKSLSNEEILKAIDWDAYNYIATKGSLAKGGEYLIGEVMGLVRDRLIPDAVKQLRAEMEGRMTPVLQTHEQAQAIEGMTRVTHQLAGLKTTDGRVAFPELSDAQKLAEIGYYWAREAKGEADAERRFEALQTPQGLMNAIALYRLMKGLEPPAEPTATVPVPEGLPKEEVAPGPAASLSVRGDEGARLGGALRTNLPPEMARMVADLSRGEMIDPVLGFARHRRP